LENAMAQDNRKRQGFGSMSEEQKKRIASMGGKESQRLARSWA